METAGKLVDDDELREAMKDSGIGTPATRAAIIERLITVGYIERDGRALVATEKGLNVIRLLNEHALTSPGLTGSWEQRLGKIERGEDSRKKFMSDIAGFAEETVKELDETLKDVRIPRARLGPVPGLRPRDRREPQGLLLLGARGSGLRLRDLEGQSRQAAAARGRQGADQDRLHRPGGDGLSRAQRAQLPRPPGAQPDRGGQMARGVRRAVGASEGAKPPEAEGEAARRGRRGDAPRRRRSADARAAAAPSAAERLPHAPARVGSVRQDGLVMPITLITGPANAGKAQVVLDAVRRASPAARSRCWSCRRVPTPSTTCASWPATAPRWGCASSASRG